MKPTYLAAALLLAFSSTSYALPAGGAVTAGGASIATAPGNLTVTQSTQNVAINWQSFSIGATEAVRFVQPNSASVALNRVIGQDPSAILGSLSSNGKVFLTNPNGILFAPGSQVNVGALVASTRNISDANFMAGNYKFEGNGSGAVVNQGTINAPGGSVALLGATVSNQGVIAARMGNITLAAGSAFTLDVAGDGLLQVAVDRGSVDALVQNGGLIQADGGHVLLTAKSASTLLQSAVNNTGVIQAQTVENHAGIIRLMGDMVSGTVNAAGTLDASAPNGGSGGFIETSAANVKIANDVRVTTAAPNGLNGTWLIDPVDFTVGSAPGDNITGAALSAQLIDTDITIATVAGPGAGNGDIFITEAVVWNGALGVSAVPTTLTLNALRNVNVGSNSLGAIIPGATITPTNGNITIRAGQDVNIDAAISPTAGNLVVCCGQDINVRAAISTVNGSVLLNAGRDIRVERTLASPATAVTTTDGNIEMCAGRDIILDNQLNPGTTLMTLTRGTATAGQSLAELGVPLGMTLRAGNAATSPGPAGGTVNFVNGGLAGTFATVTGPGAPVQIFYNPINYTTPTAYSLNFTGTGGPVTNFMLVFPDVAPKIADGTTTATLAGFRTTATSGVVPGTVTLAGAGIANFDDANAGINKRVTFSGFTLAQGAILPGDGNINFALPTTCCLPRVGTTTGIITAVTAGSAVGSATQLQLPLPFLGLPVFAGLDLDIGGITMPTPVAEAPLELIPLPEVVPPPVVVKPPPPPAPAPVYVAPPRPARQDRN